MNSFLFQTITQKLPRRFLAKFGFEKRSKHRRQSVKLSCVDELIMSKFEATLLGALIGDCVGKPFEGMWGPNLTEMLDEFRVLKESMLEYDSSDDADLDEAANTYPTSGSGDGDSSTPSPSVVSAYTSEHLKIYTDDTAMTRAVCESLLASGDFDLEDMLGALQVAYTKDPERGYASGAITLFRKFAKLKANSELLAKCFMPATELFNGEGSFGNGAGMRCSPVALFTYAKSLDEMKLICELCTKLTHTHIWAVIGALQQCFAVRQALHSNKSAYSFDFDAYYQSVLNFVCDLERTYESWDELTLENMERYSPTVRRSALLYLEQKKKMQHQLQQQQQQKFQTNNSYTLNFLRSGTNSNADSVESLNVLAAPNRSTTASERKGGAASGGGSGSSSRSRPSQSPVIGGANSSGSGNGNGNGGNSPIGAETTNQTYSTLLRKLNKLIVKCRRGERINLERLYKQVAGCGISAIESIPMALFAFMVASDPKCACEVNSKLNAHDAFKEYHPIERVIFYAISFGGESNKIASMAGAIAGAFFSRRDLPRYLVEMCESHRQVRLHAQRLFELSVPVRTGGAGLDNGGCGDGDGDGDGADEVVNDEESSSFNGLPSSFNSGGEAAFSRSVDLPAPPTTTTKMTKTLLATPQQQQRSAAALRRSPMLGQRANTISSSRST